MKSELFHPDKKVVVKLAVLVGVVFISLAFMTIVSLWNLGNALTSADWVNHSHAVLDESRQILNSLDAAESSMHQFLLNRKETDQALLQLSLNEANEHLQIAKGLTRNEPGALAEFEAIEPAITNLAALTEKVIARPPDQSGGVKPEDLDAREPIKTAIKNRLATLEQTQAAILHERDKSLYLRAQMTRRVLYSGVVLNLLIVLAMVYLVHDDISVRNREAKMLKEANQLLEQKVAERTRELAFENLENKWAVQALEHQLRHNQLIMDFVADLVIVISKERNITQINGAVTRKTGWTAAEVIGAPLARILQVETPLGSNANFNSESLFNDPSRELFGVIQSKNGGNVPAAFSIRPIHEKNQIVGAVITVHPLGEPDAEHAASISSRET